MNLGWPTRVTTSAAGAVVHDESLSYARLLASLASQCTMAVEEDEVREDVVVFSILLKAPFS